MTPLPSSSAPNLAGKDDGRFCTSQFAAETRRWLLVALLMLGVIHVDIKLKQASARAPPPRPGALVCPPIFKGDSKVRQCNAYCNVLSKVEHCSRCQCKACPMCSTGGRQQDGLAAGSTDLVPMGTPKMACGLGAPVAIATLADLVNKSVEASLQAAVRSAINVSSPCVPSGAVMLSYTIDAYSSMRELGLLRISTLPCLMKRFVSVCFGTRGTTHGTCVGARTLPTAEFRQGLYFHFMWLRWRLMAIAMRDASSVLWVDPDVMLLQSPFPSLPEPSSKTAGDLLYSLSAGRTCDVPHATFPGCYKASAACKMHSGFVYIRKRQIVKSIDNHFKAHVFPELSRIGGRSLPLCGEHTASDQLIDQLNVMGFLTKSTHSSCALPGSMVLGDPVYAQRLLARASSNTATTREECGLVALHQQAGSKVVDKVKAMKVIQNSGHLDRCLELCPEISRYGSGALCRGNAETFLDGAK